MSINQQLQYPVCQGLHCADSIRCMAVSSVSGGGKRFKAEIRDYINAVASEGLTTAEKKSSMYSK